MYLFFIENKRKNFLLKKKKRISADIRSDICRISVDILSDHPDDLSGLSG